MPWGKAAHTNCQFKPHNTIVKFSKIQRIDRPRKRSQMNKSNAATARSSMSISARDPGQTPPSWNRKQRICYWILYWDWQPYEVTQIKENCRKETCFITTSACSLNVYIICIGQKYKLMNEKNFHKCWYWSPSKNYLIMIKVSSNLKTHLNIFLYLTRVKSSINMNYLGISKPD